MSYQPQELKNKVERKINKVKAQFEFEEDFFILQPDFRAQEPKFPQTDVFARAL